MTTVFLSHQYYRADQEGFNGTMNNFSFLLSSTLAGGNSLGTGTLQMDASVSSDGVAVSKMLTSFFVFASTVLNSADCFSYRQFTYFSAAFFSRWVCQCLDVNAALAIHLHYLFSRQSEPG